MNGGQIVGFVWVVAVWFFLVSVFLFPISLSMWRARERQRAEETEKVLKTIGFNTSHQYEQDAL